MADVVGQTGSPALLYGAAVVLRGVHVEKDLVGDDVPGIHTGVGESGHEGHHPVLTPAQTVLQHRQHAGAGARCCPGR